MTMKFLCDTFVALGNEPARFECNDMVSVDRSIEETYNLERYIDAQAGGPGQGWFRIVKSPAEAREVIRPVANVVPGVGLEEPDPARDFLLGRVGVFEGAADALEGLVQVQVRTLQLLPGLAGDVQLLERGVERSLRLAPAFLVFALETVDAIAVLRVLLGPPLGECSELAVELRYPTFREGLRSLIPKETPPSR